MLHLLQNCYTHLSEESETNQMKNFLSYRKKIRFTYIKATLFTLFLCLLWLDWNLEIEQTGNNFFHVVLNGVEVGTLGEEDQAEALLLKARKNIASRSEELTFIEVSMEVTGEEVLFGEIDHADVVLSRMEEVLKNSIRETMHRSYTMKVNEYMVNLSSAEEVIQLLQAAVDKYDTEGKFVVELVNDSEREFNVLTARVVRKSEAEEETHDNYQDGGVALFFASMSENLETKEEKDFEDYDLGLLSVDFAEEVEIVEAYLPESSLTPLSVAIDEVIKEQETASEYEIVAGDTLSEISIKVNIPLDDLIALNPDKLEDERSTLHIGDKLIIMVPEPELSVTRVEEIYQEEIYDAPVIYVDRDDWYTTQTRVIQQPSAGFRKIVADVSYVNDKLVSKEVLKEEIVLEAVPKIMERGTKTPPSFIKPISGGRLSSGFGKRTAPKKGASTYHKGVDWATPTGTPVYASSGGTVAKAGWGSGYGYVVYINHEDGSQTRYGHLSKVLVKAGQKVKQGEKIALSGNTGVSTGPHLHFEILINGVQVNPFKYLN